MFTRFAGALLRSILFFAIIAIPALLVRDISGPAVDLALVIAALSGLFVLIEYGARSPSFVEFRFAAPINRLRAVLLAGILLCATFGLSAASVPRAIWDWHVAWMQTSRQIWDFAFSPIAMLEGAFEAASLDVRDAILGSAASALTFAVLTSLILIPLLFVMRWPLICSRTSTWSNLPTLTLKSERGTAYDLRRSGVLSLIFAVLFLYGAPLAALTLAPSVQSTDPGSILFLVWAITIWSFVPASAIIRFAILFGMAHDPGTAQPATS